MYSNVGFLRALDTLFRLPNNEAALRQIENFNIQLKAYNKRNNKKESTGAVPIRELAKFYTRAHKVIEGFEEASDEDQLKKQEEMSKIFEESRIYCEGLGLPRSFSWPSPDCNRRPFFWLASDKKKEDVNDGMPTAKEWRKMAEPSGAGAANPGQQGSSPGSSQDPDLPMADADFTGTGRAQGGTSGNPRGGAFGGTQFTAATETQTMPLVQSSFIGFEEARRQKRTFDGKKLLAAKKIGAKNWCIIVNEGTEEAPVYRFRSGNDCGGKKVINGIVEHLPRLGHLDAAFIAHEKKAEDSSFTRLLGIAQLGTQTYCYTDWEGKEPLWISRSELSDCLGSKPMVDQLVQELGAELPMRRCEIERTLEEIRLEAERDALLQLEPIAPHEASQQLATQPSRYRAPPSGLPQYLPWPGSSFPRQSRFLRHRAFPAPSLDSLNQQFASIQL